MSTLDSVEEVRLLQELLADAHSRIRELQFQLDQLVDELITVKLNDRRRSVGYSNVECERRRNGVRAAGSERKHHALSRCEVRQEVI